MRQSISEWLVAPGDCARVRRDEFVRGRGLIVTTGQQAGLFTGPMLTIAKALTAVRLAEVLQNRLGRPVLPVFWIAADDHDYDEVRTTWFSAGMSVRPLRLPDLEGNGAPPVGRIEVPREVESVLHEAADVLGQEPYGGDVLEWIRGAYQPGISLSAAFQEVLGRILARTPICLLDASSRAVHAASAPMYEQEIAVGRPAAEALRQQAARLATEGFAPQVPLLDDATNLFLEHRGARERLFRRDDCFFTGASGERLSAGEIRTIIARDPERVSPNVLLRPVVEAAILPTVAQIAGPSELRYLAQIGPLFDAYAVERPLVVPRRSVSVVEGWAEEEMSALGLSETDLLLPSEQMWEVYVRRHHAESVGPLSSDLRRAISEAYRTFVERSEAMPDDARRRVLALRNRSLSLAHDAERAVVRSVKRSASHDRARLNAVRSALRPLEGPQDRTLNILPFIARHGPGIVDRMEQAIGRTIGAGAGDRPAEHPAETR